MRNQLDMLGAIRRDILSRISDHPASKACHDTWKAGTRRRHFRRAARYSGTARKSQRLAWRLRCTGGRNCVPPAWLKPT
jgi:hypothetical protein